MNPFKNAQWIWAVNSLDKDDYAEFIGDFISDEEEVEVLIDADSAYAFYLNDELIKFMTTSDYIESKFYDSFIAKAIKGKNRFKIQVWHYGIDSSVYQNDTHGVIFEIRNKENVLTYSNSKAQSRIMSEFKNGYCKQITSQLGLSFYYDNRISDTFYHESEVVNKSYNFDLRAINNIQLLPRKNTKIFKNNGLLLVDLLKETAGFIDFEIESKYEQLLTISYGEHIKDGCVRRLIGPRDFSIEIYLKKGLNKFINPLRRIAGRYLQLECENEINVIYMGIRPVKYSHKVISKDYKDELLNRIYKTSIDTLELCMHEHYEDCPWREQALYTLDSRNQMLCGYYAFESFEYQKHNLLLIAKGFNKDTGLLSLTFPSGFTFFAIPFFSLIYIKQIYEYIEHTKDRTILDATSNVIHGIMNTFLSRIDKNNLLPYFEKPFWNFYEWTPYSDNGCDLSPDVPPKKEYELTINVMLVYTIDIYNKLFNLNVDSSKIKKAIKDMFYVQDKHLYYLRTGNKDKFSQLSNALVYLCGLGDEGLLDTLIHDKTLIEASLSTRCFVYDALLIHKEKYHDFIIDDIKTRYKKMLDNGATSFYETEEGEDAFDGAGSLCHGWSAMPIYYLNKILLK